MQYNKGNGRFVERREAANPRVSREPARGAWPSTGLDLFAWALVRDDPTLKGTEADRYVRREYGGPNVAWLLSANASPETPAEPTHDDDVSEGLLRRVSQAIASFW